MLARPGGATRHRRDSDIKSRLLTELLTEARVEQLPLEGIVSSQDLLELAAVLLEHIFQGVVAALLEDAVAMPRRRGPDLLADDRIARLVELARDVVGLAARLARRIIRSFLAVAAGAAQLLPFDTYEPSSKGTLRSLTTTRPPATL